MTRFVKLIGGRAARRWIHLGRWTKARFFPDRLKTPLYGGTLLDDFLFGQPFNTVLRLVRAVGRYRPVRASGVSVVVVNWNSMPVTATVLEALRKFSPPATEIIVVDNGSTDGSRQWLKSRPFEAKVICLPSNVMHGRALDIGFAMASRPIVISLDSDAFPFVSGWLDPFLEELSDPSIAAAGMRGKRERLHPACAAFSRVDYFRAATSFTNHARVPPGDERRFGENVWDTGELLFERLGRDSVKLVETRRSRFGGVVVGGVVYHHEAMTTSAVKQGPRHESKAEHWEQAVNALLRSPTPEEV